MKPICATVVLVAALTLGACQTPVFKKQELSSDALDAELRKQEIGLLQYQLRQQKRLRNLAYPILRDGVEMCGEKIGVAVGFDTETAKGFLKKDQEAATEAFNLGTLPVILIVIKGAPAARAGLKEGDVIVSFDGLPVQSGDDSNASLTRNMEQFANTRSQVFDLAFRRAGTEMTFSIRPDITCDYPIQFRPDNSLNAAADSKSIFVSAGMIRFVENDDELATVIGHELAHNTMRHIQKRQTNQTAGMAAGVVLDILAAVAGVNTQGGFTRSMGDIGNQAYSQDFESEADYVGLYYLARAGFDIDAAAPFWRRMGAARTNIQELKLSGSHPTSTERFLRLEKATAEIKAKIAAGKPLVPDLEKEAPWLKKEPKASDTEEEEPSS